MSENEARTVAMAEARKVVTELQGAMKLRESQLADVTGALAVAFMRGMVYAARGVGDELRAGLTKTDPKRRRS